MDNDKGVEYKIKRIPDYNWDKYALTVTHDGYTETGRRIHIVKESCSVAIKDNIIVVPESLMLWLDNIINNFEE